MGNTTTTSFLCHFSFSLGVFHHGATRFKIVFCFPVDYRLLSPPHLYLSFSSDRLSTCPRSSSLKRLRLQLWHRHRYRSWYHLLLRRCDAARKSRNHRQRSRKPNHPLIRGLYRRRAVSGRRSKESIRCESYENNL